jgi:quercetin dioxygenase-like cupin family protein
LYKIDFENISWESPMSGVRHKRKIIGSTAIRLVEYSKDMPVHWCEKGHMGYVLEGILEIQFENEKQVFRAGDGIFIPDGKEHAHAGRVLSDMAKIFFVETMDGN